MKVLPSKTVNLPPKHPESVKKIKANKLKCKQDIAVDDIVSSFLKESESSKLTKPKRYLNRSYSKFFKISFIERRA